MVLEPGIKGWASGVVFDENGNAYVYGTRYVIKYSKDGKELARANTGVEAEGAAYVNSRLYVVTTDDRLIVFDADLRKLDEVDLRQEITIRVEVGEFGAIDRVAFDGGTIYVAGYAVPKGASDDGWLVFALQPMAPVFVPAPPSSPVTPPSPAAATQTTATQAVATDTVTATVTRTAYVGVGEGFWLLAAAAVAAVAAAVVIAVRRRRRVIEVEPLTEGEETQVR
jgi:hypothetical protein